MTRRSALLTGLTVLMVLLGGQVIGAWYRRPASDLTTASNTAAIRPVAPAKPTPQPTATATPPPGQTPVVPPRKPGTHGPAAMGVMMITGDRGVALTFDDGPNPAYTPKVLALLRANHLHATFCVVGTEVRKYPQLVAQIAREGHSLCNHSWHHELDLGSWPASKIRANLNRTNDEIRRAAPGAVIRYFRQPGGLWTRRGVNVAAELGMFSIGWTVDPSDWEKPPSGTIRARVLAQSYPGAVILMHDGGGDRSSTVAACRSLLPALRHRYAVTQLR